MAAQPVQTYDNTIFDFVQNRGSNYDASVLAEFKKLQRLNLTYIQNDLAALKGEIYIAKAVTQEQRLTLCQTL
jgi:hypothetical protein